MLKIDFLYGFWMNFFQLIPDSRFPDLIFEMTCRADMSRRVIPAREALRIGFWNDLRAELIGNFGVGKTIVPDLAQVELAHTQNIVS